MQNCIKIILEERVSLLYQILPPNTTQQKPVKLKLDEKQKKGDVTRQKHSNHWR